MASSLASRRRCSAAIVVGLCMAGCQQRPPPVEQQLEPAPAVAAEQTARAMTAAVLAGPITAERMLDLPPPPAGRPTCVEQAHPYALPTWPVVIDRGDAFTVDDFGGQIVAQPGGSLADARVLAVVPRSELELGDEQLSGLAVDGSTAFFTANLRSFDASESAWALRAVPRTGGAAVVLARGATSGGFAGPVALDGTHVYFLHTVSRDLRTEGTLWRVEKGGGEPVPVVQGLGDHFAWTLAGDEIVYHSRDHHEIRRVPKAGGEPTTVLATDAMPGRILVAERSMYFTTSEPSATGGTITLHAVALDGPASATAVASYQGWLSSVRHDGDSLYWAEFVDDSIGSLQRVLSKRGSAPPRVAYEPIGHSEAWEIHGGTVYWGTTRCVRSAELAR